MNVRGIDANYYTVVDLDAMTAFYTKLLGKPAVTIARISEWTFADDSSFGLYQAGGKTAGRSGSVMFAVDDVEAAVRDAREAGARIDDDHAITETPVCRMAFAYDPEGNQFILHKRKT